MLWWYSNAKWEKKNVIRLGQEEEKNIGNGRNNGKSEQLFCQHLVPSLYFYRYKIIILQGMNIPFSYHYYWLVKYEKDTLIYLSWRLIYKGHILFIIITGTLESKL